MQVTISDAKGLLTDLVRRAERGEEVILTRHGQPVARVVPVTQRKTQAERRAAIDAARAAGRARATPGPDAAHSQDFLYDEDGLPA
jgi:prevent-host-death family protein